MYNRQLVDKGRILNMVGNVHTFSAVLFGLLLEPYLLIFFAQDTCVPNQAIYRKELCDRGSRLKRHNCRSALDTV